jgi:hypothetical protein
MGTLTPKKGELARQIRAASAQLRSPCRPAPQAPKSQALVARERSAVTTVIEQLYSSPTEDPSVEPHESPAPVDLRFLRLQMERSLARLQSGEISPPSQMKPPLAAKAVAAEQQLLQECARTDGQTTTGHIVRPSVGSVAWASTVVKLFWQSRERDRVHMVLLKWGEVTGREKRDELAHVVSQLEGELIAAELLLAEYQDPARTQALDELALQMLNKDMALENEQAERQGEREQWERERAEWEMERGTRERAREEEMAEISKAWARAKEEKEALGQLLDEERQAQVRSPCRVCIKAHVKAVPFRPECRGAGAPPTGH